MVERKGKAFIDDDLALQRGEDDWQRGEIRAPLSGISIGLFV
jgi:hypothetical protein